MFSRKTLLGWSGKCPEQCNKIRDLTVITLSIVRGRRQGSLNNGVCCLEGLLYIVTIPEDIKIAPIFSFLYESYELIKPTKQSRLFHLRWLEELSRWLRWPYNRCQVCVVWSRKWMLYARTETMKMRSLSSSLALGSKVFTLFLPPFLFLAKWITIYVKVLCIRLLDESNCLLRH